MPGAAQAIRQGLWSPPFTPKRIPGLVGWFSALRLTGIPEADPLGATWLNLAGNGFHLAQATSSKQPTYRGNIINGRPALLFDATDDELYSAGLGPTFSGSDVPVSVLAVVRTGSNVAAATSRIAWSASNSGDANPFLILKYDSSLWGVARRDDAASIVDAAGATPVVNTNYVHSTIFAGTTVSTWVNGTADEVDTAMNVGAMTVDAFGAGARQGNAEFFNGYIGEILVYNRAITSAERQTLERRWFAKQWGIAVA